MIAARPPKVTTEMVRGLMDAPPYWLAGSYIPAWKAGRIPTVSLAFGVVAALGHSPYDAEVVDEVASILVSLSYTHEPISAAVWA